jgi:hypothetical protein
LPFGAPAAELVRTVIRLAPPRPRGRTLPRHQSLFKYPDLFCSAAPMGGGRQHEKRIAENNDDKGAYQFEPQNNTYDLATKSAPGGK